MSDYTYAHLSDEYLASNAKRDLQFVQEYCKELRARGYSTWLDPGSSRLPITLSDKDTALTLSIFKSVSL